MSALSPATVLVADDSLVVRSVVRSRLEQEHYRVIEAEDGDAALRQCRALSPDVVLLDVEMPGRSGHEVLAELKRDPTVADIPVVFLTGRTSMEDVLSGLRGGAHDYLKKPFEPAELVARIGAAAHVKKLQDSLRARNVELELMSRTDMLTTLYNRRHLEDELSRAHQVAIRNDQPVGVLLLDIDHFKQVNDTYGHAGGDRVLRNFADQLRRELRAGDIAGRFGGEEFLVILPNTGLADSVLVAERIRAATAAGTTRSGDDVISVSVSGGCAVGPIASADELVRLADDRLYLAKGSGRNRIVSSGRPAPGPGESAGPVVQPT